MRNYKRFLVAALATACITGCGSSSEKTVTTAAVEATSASVSETTSAEAESKTEAETTTEAVTTEEATTAATVDENLGIKDVFAEYNMKAGVCLTPAMIAGPFVRNIVLQHFNSITMENAMKPDYILSQSKSKEAGDIVVEFNKDMLLMLDWAKENNMAVRGHTLVWYSQTPEWIFYDNFDKSGELVGREEMLARLESYIKQVFELLTEGGYIDMFYAYDVVNEAWMENGSMRDNLWRQTIGDDYLYQSFFIADKYAPETVDLYYNDYNEQMKQSTLLKFVDTLKDEDGRYLIDGIGLQAHLYTRDDLNQYFKVLDALSETGLKIQLTELDVGLGSWNNPLEADEKNLKTQASFYYQLISGILERVKAGTLKSDALTFWGFADTMSWRKEYSPLFYDKEYKAKPALYAVMLDKAAAGLE